VVLCGLTAKVELNELAGYTTDRTQSGRWGVRLDKHPNRRPVAVKPENLRIIPCESLAEKHFLQLCAVQKIVPERSQLKKLVWSFLRVPEELVVLSFVPLEFDVAGLLRVTVQIVSLQNSRIVRGCYDDMSRYEFDCLRFSMRGPSHVVAYENAHWQNCFGFADAARSQPLVPRWIGPRKQSPTTWFLANVPASSFPDWICGLDLEGQSAASDEMCFNAFDDNWTSVASLQGNWIARLRSDRYGCWIFDSTTGLKLGHCTEKVVKGSELMVSNDSHLAADRDLLVVSWIVRLTMVKVVRNLLSESADVSVVGVITSSVPASISLFEPLLALVPEMGVSVDIHKITFPEPAHVGVVAQIYPHSLQMISSVYLTSDQVVTMEVDALLIECRMERYWLAKSLYTVLPTPLEPHCSCCA